MRLGSLLVYERDGTPRCVVKDVRLCESADSAAHAPRPAVACLHWVTGPIDYCGHCAAQMLGIAQALGVHVRVDAIAMQPELLADFVPHRGIDLEAKEV